MYLVQVVVNINHSFPCEPFTQVVELAGSMNPLYLELQSSIIAQKKEKFVRFYLIPMMRKSDHYFFFSKSALEQIWSVSLKCIKVVQPM